MMTVQSMYGVGYLISIVAAAMLAGWMFCRADVEFKRVHGKGKRKK